MTVNNVLRVTTGSDSGIVQLQPGKATQIRLKISSETLAFLT